MRRLPGIALLVVVVGLTGCAIHQLPEMDRNPNKTFQNNNTAYIAVLLFTDTSGSCNAKVSPETLLVVKKRFTGPSKANVEWEVVNHCWDGEAAEEITIEFLNNRNPTERHGSNPKEVATMPNKASGVSDPSRDQIRRKLKRDPGEGAYDYVIKRKIGAGDPETVVDPRIEYEYRR